MFYSGPDSRNTSSFLIGLALLCAAPVGVYAEGGADNSVFAAYARYGADAWARNPMALISGEGRACISCHTSLPYALVEPLLSEAYPAYDNMIENIDQRIRGWDGNTPWYSDAKLEESAILASLPPDTLKQFLDARDSRGVEAVFNALISAMQDAYAGNSASMETRQAFENLWAEQNNSGPAVGRWGWIEANLIPWEASDSDLWGASLACVATGLFPDLAPQENLRLLDTTLKQAVSNPDVSLHSKAAVLWCDTEVGRRLLADEEADALVAELVVLQRPDGGWALRDLGPWTGWEGSPKDCCANRELRSDAYATGFITLILDRVRQNGSGDPEDPTDKAVVWIDRQLVNPYPAGPRYNAHSSSDAQLPELREQLYPNGGAMWAYLAKWTHEMGRAPWQAE